MKAMKKPVLLCIMDGFGKNPSDYGNAIVAANTPNIDKSMLAGKIQKLHIFFSLLIPDMTYEEKQLGDGALIKTYAIKGILPPLTASILWRSARPIPRLLICWMPHRKSVA